MADDPRTPFETTYDADPDLALLLAERDRELPILARAPREGAPAGEEPYEEQILAGLVTP
jgi:hypothetical protein